MINHITAAVKSIKSEIERLQGVLAELETGADSAEMGGGSAVKSASRPVTRGRGRGKGRRSSTDVKEQAESMVEFIKGKGKAGAATAEIVGQFGKVLPSIKAFITSKVQVKLRKTGAGRATVYFVD